MSDQLSKAVDVVIALINNRKDSYTIENVNELIAAIYKKLKSLEPIEEN